MFDVDFSRVIKYIIPIITILIYIYSRKSYLGKMFNIVRSRIQFKLNAFRVLTFNAHIIIAVEEKKRWVDTDLK